MNCASCTQEKYGAHEDEAPHKSKPGFAECAGYVPAHPCLATHTQGATDLEQHEPDAPHPRIIGGNVVCAAAEWQGDAPPFEGGGGSGGGGGASGGW